MQTEQTKIPLTKGMYGGEFSSITSRFDIHTGQMHSECLTHNSGWYNKSGEKLGWGDLNVAEFKRIQDGLEDGELFIILNENESFWNFVTQIGELGSLCQTKSDVESPGVDYVVKHAFYVITEDNFYSPARDLVIKSRGLTFEPMSEKELKKLMKGK